MFLGIDQGFINFHDIPAPVYEETYFTSYPDATEEELALRVVAEMVQDRLGSSGKAPNVYVRDGTGTHPFGWLIDSGQTDISQLGVSQVSATILGSDGSINHATRLVKGSSNDISPEKFSTLSVLRANEVGRISTCAVTNDAANRARSGFVEFIGKSTGNFTSAELAAARLLLAES